MCSLLDGITKLISALGVLVSSATVLISSFFSYKFAIRLSTYEEKKKVYTELINLIYELHDDPDILFNADMEYLSRCLSIRANLKLFSDDALMDKTSEFYDKLRQKYNGYIKTYNKIVEPYGADYRIISDLELDEMDEKIKKAMEENRVDPEWLMKYLNEISYLMRNKDKMFKKLKRKRQ